MKKFLTALILATAILVSAARAQTAFIAGWDFQTTTSGGTAVAAQPNTPTLFNANFGSGTLYLNGSFGSSTWLPASELNAFAGTGVNASNGLTTTTTSPAALALLGGTGLSANGKSLVFAFDMSGFTDLSITFAAQRSSATASFDSFLFEYSSNASTWTLIDTITGGTGANQINTSFANSGVLSLSTTGLDDVATAYVRMTVSGSTNATSNVRLDNFQFNAVPEPSTYALLALSGLALAGYAARRRQRE